LAISFLLRWILVFQFPATQHREPENGSGITLKAPEIFPESKSMAILGQDC
jgi:hypothetical protein